MSDLMKLTADELRVRFDVLRPKMNVPARLVLAEISYRLERLEKCEAALKQIYQIASRSLAESLNESTAYVVDICTIIETLDLAIVDAARAALEGGE